VIKEQGFRGVLGIIAGLVRSLFNIHSTSLSASRDIGTVGDLFKIREIRVTSYAEAQLTTNEAALGLLKMVARIGGGHVTF